MKRVAASLVAIALSAVALSASADPHRNVITLKPVDIIGVRQVPVASVEVSRATVTVRPSELRQPLMDRLEASAHSSAL
jgi:hypothetical protein